MEIRGSEAAQGAARALRLPPTDEMTGSRISPSSTGDEAPTTTTTAAAAVSPATSAGAETPAQIAELSLGADLRRLQIQRAAGVAETAPAVTAAQQQTTPENKVGELQQGVGVPTTIGATDSQADVLRRAYAQYGERAGLRDPAAFATSRVKDGDVILHADTKQPFTAKEFEKLRAAGKVNMLPTADDLTAARQTKINDLLSRSMTDWFVTADDQRQVVDLLRNDPNLSATVGGLNGKGRVGDLLGGVSDTTQRRELIDLLGRRLDPAIADQVAPHVEKLDVDEGLFSTSVNDNLWQARFNLARLGVTASGAPFDRASFSDLISPDPSAPFSGVGATGANPTDGGVSLADQFGLLRGDEETTRRYSNPIPGSLPGYLSSLSSQDRSRQAQLMLGQPISTVMPEIYGDRLPSRADVVRAAAAKYNLEPELVAGFILAEQRDQSGREDAKDYTAATSVKQGNTSIGLGQVVISTARRNRLFSDLVSDRTQSAMSHDDTARLLADDTANIFAVAKYIRQVADDGAGRSIADLPATRTKFPAINLQNYRGNSRQWPADNVRALGSEYTSRAWDDNLSPGWGDFVYEAYRDVQSSGVFRPR